MVMHSWEWHVDSLLMPSASISLSDDAQKGLFRKFLYLLSLIPNFRKLIDKLNHI
jgi:hypothetical protein